MARGLRFDPMEVRDVGWHPSSGGCVFSPDDSPSVGPRLRGTVRGHSRVPGLGYTQPAGKWGQPLRFVRHLRGSLIPGEKNYVNTELEPWVAVNPTDPSNIIGVCQQDRYTFGGARGLGAAVTHDGGAHWSSTHPAFSTCAGGTETNGGNFQRSSDPWVTVSPNGDAYFISLSFKLPRPRVGDRKRDSGEQVHRRRVHLVAALTDRPVARRRAGLHAVSSRGE
jgi:hypothetical protein